MAEVSSTNAARSFSDILDAVEHRRESFTIVRRGKAIAQLGPIATGRGTEVKSMLRQHRADCRFAEDMASVRQLLEIEARS